MEGGKGEAGDDAGIEKHAGDSGGENSRDSPVASEADSLEEEEEVSRISIAIISQVLNALQRTSREKNGKYR